MNNFEDRSERFLEEIEKHLVRFAGLLALGRLTNDDLGKMREVGNYWKGVRKEQQLSRGEVAAKLQDYGASDLLAFEAGLIPLADLPGRFVQDLANALTRPNAFYEFLQKVGWTVPDEYFEKPTE